MANNSQPLLIIEDNDDDFSSTDRAFKKAGLRNPIQRCRNSGDALDYLFQRGEFADPKNSPRPCLILLDLNLQGTDGREVLRAIKNDAQLRRIPVIVLSASNAKQDIADCYDEGANAYVHKPLNFAWHTEVMARIKEFWLDVSLVP